MVPLSPGAHPPAKRHTGGGAAEHRGQLTPGDERAAAADSEKNHAVHLSARAADDDSYDEDADCPPRPPRPTRKYK